jgi:hypothetical protein
MPTFQANGVSHNFTIVYTHGCMCGGFDVSDCIAERMIGIDTCSGFIEIPVTAGSTRHD